MVPPQALAILDSQDKSQLSMTQHLLHGVLEMPSACWPRVGSTNPRLMHTSATPTPAPGSSLSSPVPWAQSLEGWGPQLSIPTEMSPLSARPPERDSTTVSAVSGAGSGSRSGLQPPRDFWLPASLHFLAPRPQSLGTKGPIVT